MWYAKEGKVKFRNTDKDYVTFGKGQGTIIMLPGLGDGLKTVKGMGITLARMYKVSAEEYRVYIISRKNNIQEGYSTRDMASDYRIAMVNLGIKNAHIIGIFQRWNDSPIHSY